MALTLNTFIERYAEINNMSKAKSKEEILRFTDVFKICTIEDGGIDLRGFLKSEVVDVPAKKVRNPKDGSIIDVPAKKVVKVKISSKFKNMED